MAGWMDLLGNPKAMYIKKAMFDVLQERYQTNEAIIDRLSVMLVTESDTQAFFKMVTDIYEKAYMKSVMDHREQLAKLGVVAKIVPTQAK